MSERRYRLRLGLFLLLGAVMLAFLLFLFGGAPRLFVPSDPYTVVFTEAPGIQPGTPVRRSGVRIGEVEGLELDPVTGLVRISLRLDPKYPPRDQEHVTISRSLLSGDGVIDFVPVDPDVQPMNLGDPLPPGTELVGLTPTSARSLLSQASDVLPSAQQSLDQIRQSMARFEELAPRVEEALVSIRDLGRGGSELVGELRRTNDTVRDFLLEIREVRPAISQTNQELQAFLRNSNTFVEEMRQVVKVNEPRVVRAIEEFTETTIRIGEVLTDENRRNFAKTLENISVASERLDPLAQKADEGIDQVQRTLEQLDTTLREMEMTLKDIRRTTQPLGERSDQIVQNFDESLSNLNLLLTDFRQIVMTAARADGTLQRFLADPALYTELTMTVNGITKLLPQVQAILADVEIFADKIARHPERLGLGGAVRPDTGLKESPFQPIDVPQMHYPRE